MHTDRQVVDRQRKCLSSSRPSVAGTLQVRAAPPWVSAHFTFIAPAGAWSPFARPAWARDLQQMLDRMAPLFAFLYPNGCRQGVAAARLWCAASHSAGRIVSGMRAALRSLSEARQLGHESRHPGHLASALEWPPIPPVGPQAAGSAPAPMPVQESLPSKMAGLRRPASPGIRAGWIGGSSLTCGRGSAA